MPKMVQIRFTGIVGFVPRPSTNQFRVVVPNASKADCAHLAWFIVNKRYSNVPEHFTQLAEQGDLRAYQFDGCDVALDNIVLSGPLHVRDSFYRYILRLADGCHPVYQGGDQINLHFLRDHDPTTVSARFAIDAGVLAAAWVDPGWEWKWEHRSCNYQRLAQEIVHSFEIREDKLTLECTDEGRVGAAAFDVWSGGDEPIQIVVGNTPKEDIFPDGGDPGGRDDHVRIYFDLAAVPTPAASRAGLVRRHASRNLVNPPQSEWQPDVGVERVHGSNCPPGLWSQ